MRRIDEVHVSIGCLAMVNAEQVGYGFGMLAKGTAAEEARLVFTLTSARLRCPMGHEMEVKMERIDFDRLLPITKCCECGFPSQIVEGRDIFLTKIVGE